MELLGDEAVRVATVSNQTPHAWRAWGLLENPHSQKWLSRRTGRAEPNIQRDIHRLADLGLIETVLPRPDDIEEGDRMIRRGPNRKYWWRCHEFVRIEPAPHTDTGFVVELGPERNYDALRDMERELEE